MTDTPAPVTPRTEAGRRTLAAYDGNSLILREAILAIEREAAAPATEALRRIADEGWERSRKPGDDAAVLAEIAETALA